MLKVKTYECIYDATVREETDKAEALVQELISKEADYNRVITPQFVRITWKECEYE